MGQLYSRVFLSILDSSLAEHWKTRHVFEDLLKLSEDGLLDMTRQSIARRTNVPLEVINEAIQELESPDNDSRDEAEGGRRLIRLDEHRDWGWKIVNWHKYEELKSRQDQKAKVAERVRRHRARLQKANSCPSSPKPLITSTDSDSDPEAALQNVTPRYTAVTLNLPEELNAGGFPELWEEWQRFRKSKGGKIKDWPSLFKRQIEWLKPFGVEAASEILGRSLRNGWTGIFPPTEPKGGDARGKKTPSVLDLKTIMVAKTTEADAIQKRHSSEAAMGVTWDSTEAKAQWLNLRKEIKNLNHQIATFKP